MSTVVCENCKEEIFVEEEPLDVNDAADKLLRHYTGEHPSVFAVDTLADKIKEVLVAEFSISASAF